jgi:hypothetical protein
MLSYTTREVPRTQAVEMSYRTANKIRLDMLEKFFAGSKEYVPVCIPFGDRWLVGVQSHKGPIASYVTSYELGCDLTV